MTLKRFLKIITTVVLCAVLAPVVAGGTAFAALLYWPSPYFVPPVKTNVEAQISHLYDAKGNEIGLFRLFEQNIPVKQADIPQVLKDATVASEDKNFYKHGGVDPISIMRAAYADVTNKKIVQGGSTITQQYVRGAYLGKEQTISRKVNEAILASRIDSEMDKDEILYRYLSSVYFGDGAYGVGAAANSYFRKSVRDLTPSEAALLIGVLPAPTAYAPRENPKNAETRRKVVLKLMYEQKYLDKEQYEEAEKQEVWLESRGAPTGPATVVYSTQRQAPKYPYFYDYVRQYLVAKYGEDVVFRGGLQIQTTLDPDAQAAAEKTVQDSLGGTKPNLEMSIVSVEPQTGFVKAFVGGRDYGTSQTNLALGGCPPRRSDIEIQVAPYCWTPNNKKQPVPLSGGTGRQPGSSWKPIVLAAAYAKGIKPSRRYSGASYRIPNCRGSAKSCVITNFGGESYGTIDLKTATAHSVNGVYARLIQDVGFEETGEMAKKLGLTSAWYSQGFHSRSGTYSLGVVETSPLDMASAFGVFANRGERYSATPIVKVVDAKGKVLEDNTKRNADRVLDENVADNVNDTLKGVIENGTAARRGNIGRPAAGKTGTNTNSSDAWFVGYTPTLSTAVWLGYRDSRDSIVLPGYGLVEGGELPTLAWATFMKQALKSVKATDFNEPAPIVAPADLEKLIKEKRRRAALNGGVDVGKKRIPTPADQGNYVSGNVTPNVPVPSSTPTSIATKN